LRTKLICTALMATAFAVLVAPSGAQTIRSQGESGLVGVKLYDSGLRLLQLYGDPDEILPLGATSASGGPGGGGGGGKFGGGGGGGKLGGAGGGGGGGAGAAGGGASLNTPFDFGDQIFQGQATPDFQAGAGGDGGDTPQQRGGKFGGAGAGGGGGLGTVGSAPAQSYLRWVYNRDGCRYSFILDKNDRVVQIEAIGLINTKVRTRKGIGFGNTFKDVMEAYQLPEGYQINGDTIIMRYLTRDKVAFRLNRLGPKKPHVVTAIVVAAGKT